MNTDATQKVRSIRIGEETFDKFRTIAADFPNQGEAIASMISAWEIQKARAVITERTAEISNYDAHLQAIQAAFLHSLELNENAEGRIRQEFKSMLDSKDKTIADLQRQLEQAKTEARDAESRASAAEATTADVNARLEAEAAARRTAEKALQAADATITDKIRIVDDLTRRLATSDGAETRIKEAEEKTRAALEDARLARTAEATAKTEIARMQAEMELVKSQAAVERKHAVLDARQEGQDRIGELMDENHKLMQEIMTLRATKNNAETADSTT